MEVIYLSYEPVTEQHDKENQKGGRIGGTFWNPEYGALHTATLYYKFHWLRKLTLLQDASKENQIFGLHLSLKMEEGKIPS